MQKTALILDKNRTGDVKLVVYLMCNVTKIIKRNAYGRLAVKLNAVQHTFLLPRHKLICGVALRFDFIIRLDCNITQITTRNFIEN